MYVMMEMVEIQISKSPEDLPLSRIYHWCLSSGADRIEDMLRAPSIAAYINHLELPRPLSSRFLQHCSIAIMNDIHAPTVPSGPASGDAPRDLSNLSMPDLMQEKERIEDELSALSNVLQSVGFPTQEFYKY